METICESTVGSDTSCDSSLMSFFPAAARTSFTPRSTSLPASSFW